MRTQTNTIPKAIRRGEGPDPVDVYAGGRLRMRRTLLSMSQEKLADQLGVTFQQVQKYENGSNRIGTSRLYNIGQVLGVPIGYFVEGYAAEDEIQISPETKQMDKHLRSRETVNLVQNYYNIEKTARRAILSMMETLSHGGV